MTDLAEAKRQAESLVRTAEALVAKAREEAESVVADGERRARGVVTDAEQLRQTAERHAESVRAEAEQILANARSRADDILAEAKAAHDHAVNTVRQELPSSGDSSGVVENAGTVADRMLRVARSEAEARSREITEQAKRRAEQIERDARARVEAVNKEYRELTRVVQQKELSAKAHIREMEMEIARLERLMSRTAQDARSMGKDPDPAADPFAPAEVTESGIVFPGQPDPRPTPVREQEPAASTRPQTDSSAPSRPSQPSRSPLDAELVRRGIRRRA